MSTERLLQSVGKRIFVEYYHEFMSDKLTKEALAEKLLRENINAKKLSGQFTRINCAKRIFKDNLHIESLNIIISFKNLNSSIKNKAAQLLIWERRMHKKIISKKSPEYKLEVFSSVYPILKDIVFYYTAYKELLNVYDSLSGNKELWVYTCDAYLQMAVLKWCDVFGVDRNDTHWKKIGFDADDFKHTLLSKINISEKEWSSYWKTVKHFRDNYIAHSHIEDYKYPVPKFDIALKAIFFLDEWLREQIVPDFICEQLLKDLMEQYKDIISKTFYLF